MPELPEVETMRRSIAAAAGCRIFAVEQPKNGLRPITVSPSSAAMQRHVVGRTIAEVGRVGKRVIIELGGKQDCIVIEPRMTGIVMPDDPPDEKHLRMIFQLVGGDLDRILFWDQRGLGVVRYMSREMFFSCFSSEHIGPDALKITPQRLKESLDATRRPIKVALIDQKVVAGIGNLYASEVLHTAGIHPATPCDRLDDRDLQRLCRSIHKILREAIRHRGSTLRDNTYRVSSNKSGGYQAYHRVYQRAGKKCLGCRKAEIVKIVQAQRSTFFCPLCQPPCDSGRKR